VTRFSYCMETIIQAGNKKLGIASIPIETNAKTRPSRLFKNMWQHVAKSAVTIIRASIMYRPMVMFMTTSALLFVAGLIPFVRFLYYLEFGNETGGPRHIQSLVAGSVLMIVAFLALALGVIADLIRINRILAEDSLEHQKRNRFGSAAREGGDIDLTPPWPLTVPSRSA
jgi:uncharacterized membrane protein YgdD (TMEM256/DUF423 family)